MIDDIANIKLDTVLLLLLFLKSIFSVSNKPRIGHWGAGLIRRRGLFNF